MRQSAIQWSERVILLTGATGGIGRALVDALLPLKAQLLVVGRNGEQLQRLSQLCPKYIMPVQLDLSDSDSYTTLAEIAEHHQVDMLINAAGLNSLVDFEQQSADDIQQMLQTNVLAPMLLTQQLLPTLKRQSRAWVINLGSTLGAIGHPGYVSYCSTKFALRGFSQSLRRELADTSVRVLYIAPRAVQTRMNSGAAKDMNQRLGNTMDTPEQVAQHIIKAIASEQDDTVIGWPERLFVRLNGLFPALVDKALRRQLPVIRQFVR
ncbi:SDR family oxidoreductase [Terasakiispira papahanaumokuakeensis]|uniref:SDR family oxidoreductase n=1 Tax=Terasakiispira papahanaumokuakeensis TaxID=197479 RepID=UPI000A83D61C|nr:SDR family oxidoreductase [Terasakiispira papahanaumokuakeensis]